MAALNESPSQGLPLSPQQRHLWRLGAGRNPHYRAELVISIDGVLERQHLRAAIEDVVEKHDILRSAFLTAPGSPTPALVPQRNAPPPIHEYDLRNVSRAEQQHALDALRDDLARHAFDPAHAPLFHASLAALSSDRHLLFVAMPALCTDMVGLDNLYREICRSSAERAAARGGSGVPRAPDDGVSYADVAMWHNQLLEGEDLGRAFWRERRVYEPRSLALPFERHRAGEWRFEPSRITTSIGAERLRQLEELARGHGGSLSSALLTCFKVLLWRLTEQAGVVIGVGYDGRRFPELSDTIGPLARYLPVHCGLSWTTPFTEVLATVDDSVRRIAEWQESFDWDRIGLTGGSEPFLPFCFDFEEPPPPLVIGRVAYRLQDRYVCGDRFKIRLTCVRNGDGLDTVFGYDTGTLEAADVRRLAEQFHSVLKRVIENPRAAIGELDILSPAERQRLLVEFNSTDADYPRAMCIHDLIEEQVASTPAGVAVALEARHLTYGELNARANQLAHHLRRLGVGPDVLVALCAERSLEMVVGILGVLKAGGAYVPLDPAYPKERISFVLEDTRAPVLLTQHHLTRDLPEHRSHMLCLDADWPTVATEPRDNPTPVATPDNLVYVIYTSGSTGRPKGVLITHRGLVVSNSARIGYYREPVERFLLLSPIAFDSSVVGLFWTLCQGGTLLLVPDEIQRNPAQLAEVIADQRVSHLLTLPSYYALLLEEATPRQLDCLRTVIVAGEPCPLRVVDHHRRLLPTTAMFSEYGATEATVWSSVYDCSGQTHNIAPLGRPIPNARIYVLDPHLQPVPIGVPGEIHLGGEALARGYLNRPELTAERFIPDPFSNRPGARLYKSGDLARHLASGDLEFLGRTDHQVKIRGFRVELEEVEAVLAQHPALREATVVARALSDQEAGTEDPTDLVARLRALGARSADQTGKRLVAYVVPTGEQLPTPRDLRRFLEGKLPDYMVPSVFVLLDALPRTPNGKLDRRALPAVDPVRSQPEEAFVAPRTEAESVLAKIWASLLHVEPVGVNHSFFELGGDSILSIQVAARAAQAGLRLSPRDLFQHQTIAELARVASATQLTSSEQGLVTGPVPLTPVQHWLFEQPGDPSYSNMSMLLELRQHVDLSLLDRIVQELLRHHDALRLRFVREPSGWRQVNRGAVAAPPVTRIDLSRMSDAEQDLALDAHAARLQASLDLADGPLLRAALFDRGVDRASYLLLVIHHLVVDGVSWRILCEDLETAYAQLSRQQAIQLPRKTTSFKHWAERLTRHAQAPPLEQELSYWLAEPRGPLPGLPVDFSADRATNTVGSAGTISASLSVEETRGLLQDVPKAYRTQIDDVLLTALGQTFSRWTGRQSFLVDLEGHGREAILDDVDLSRTVGWFTTIFPVLLDLGNCSHPGDALKGIKEQLRTIPNRGIGYGLLRYLRGDAGIVQKLRVLPSPEVSFNNLGQFDQVLSDGSLFRLAPRSGAPDSSPERTRSHLLEIVTTIVEGRLWTDWTYGRTLHRPATIETLVRGFMDSLRALIRHCQSPGTGDHTPSDFAEFHWDQADLDHITAAIRRAKTGA